MKPGFKYAIAVDGSKNADVAFKTALKLIGPTDSLYLITTVEQLPLDYFSAVKNYNKEYEAKQRDILLDYCAQARDTKILYSPILAKANHAGEAICKAVERNGVDFLVVGRRGMNPMKSLIMGSTSKYCVEHAPANVIVVKGNFLPEDHDRIKVVDEAEEAERSRRINTEKIVEMHDSVAAVDFAEDQERNRRTGKPADPKKVKAAKDAQLIGVVIDEEAERKRRIEAERIIDERTHHVKIFEVSD